MKTYYHPGINLDPRTAKMHTEVRAFGFWTFLMSDLIIFGLLFATYAASSTEMARAQGPGPHDLFSVTSVALQTGFLLASSLCCGMMSLAVKYRHQVSHILGWLALSGVLGAGFLFFEVRDFMNMAAAMGVPQRSSWLTTLYSLVGLHGLHVTVGVCWMMVLAGLALAKGMTDQTRTRFVVFAIYWHFLDVIWIGIFSIVFLGGLL